MRQVPNLNLIGYGMNVRAQNISVNHISLGTGMMGVKMLFKPRIGNISSMKII